MESIRNEKRGFGFAIGIFTAMIAVVVLLSSRHHGSGMNAESYEGWYDSLGV